MAEIEQLKQEVANAVTVEESAKTLILGLAAQIRSNANTPGALGPLADQLEAAHADLAAAITANTDLGQDGADQGGSSVAGTSGGSVATAGDSAGGTGGGAPAGADSGPGASALDPTVDTAAGERATQDQADPPA